MKQSCHFAKVCDVEFKKKHIGSSYFHCNFIYMCTRVDVEILCEKGTKYVSRCWGILLEDFRVIAGSFDWSQKLMIF